MQAIHTACATILVSCLLADISAAMAPAPQIGAGGGIRSVAPRYPDDPGASEFAPFVQGTPFAARRVGPIASDAADLDGDGNLDLWFLGPQANTYTSGTAPTAPQLGEVAVQFANTASLGRFYRRTSLTPTSFVGATTYHTTTSPVDQILVADPGQDEPWLLHWNPRTPNGDPRDGSLGGAMTGWKIGKDVFEIVSADHSGDGHDDIVALQRLPGNQTAIHKLVMGTQKYSFLWVESRVTMILPAPIENLRALDLDADGRTDFVASSPGIGVIACRDNGSGAFVPAEFWATGQNTIADLAVGDFDTNGHDDIAVCFPQGIVVLQSRASGSVHPWDARTFAKPTNMGSLATCRIVSADAAGTKLLFGFPVDGRCYVVYPDNPGAFGLTQGWTEDCPSSLTGPGVLGQSVIVADVDNDTDTDLVIQSPSGKVWMTLRNPLVSYAPVGLKEADMGPAPILEGPKTRRINVTVDVPQAVIDANILFMEMALYVSDPDNPEDESSYLYWGRVVPAIDPTNKNASFTVFYNEDKDAFEKLVRRYKKNRLANINTYFDVYPPNEWETIRGGPGMFMSLHAIENSTRFESSNGNEPPRKQGSTLGHKWALVAKPPSPLADLDLLPWE